MNCEVVQSEMHKCQTQNDASGFEEIFHHLATCPDCSEAFRIVAAKDESIRRTIQEFPEPSFLERRILAGLEHERTPMGRKGRNWILWTLTPVFASILALLAWAWWPPLQQHRLDHELAALLSQPPKSQFVSTDRQQLLDWSSDVMHGPAQLPPELSRVQFRSATALQIAHHKAVLLKMKNEQRASLVIVDGTLTRHPGFTFLAEDAGNASLWSDGHRTYVLLFKGSRGELQGYMERMGIATLRTAAGSPLLNPTPS